LVRFLLIGFLARLYQVRGAVVKRGVEALQ